MRTHTPTNLNQEKTDLTGPQESEDKKDKDKGRRIPPEASRLMAVIPEAEAFLLLPDEQPLALTQNTHKMVLPAGSVIAAFAVYSLRIALFPSLWNGAGLQWFIPIVSPVYREGEHWQAHHTRSAILVHVCFGAVMLVLAAMQFDKPLRRAHPKLHRWCGRAYVVCGTLTLIALQVLQDSVGAGSSGERSTLLSWFVDVTSTLWGIATFGAVAAACSKRFALHRDLMGLSLALACTPIFQRFYSWGITPSAMAARVLICGAVQPDAQPAGVQLMWARWGPPGDTMWGAGCVQSESKGALLATDPRAAPRVFSMDGYGEGEQATFALSAWMGFGSMLFIGLMPWLPKHISKQLESKLDIGNAQLCDSWRAISRRIMSTWALQTQLREALGWMAWPLYLILTGCVLGIGVFGLTVGFVGFTASFTLGILISLSSFASFVFVVWFLGSSLVALYYT